MYKRIIPVALLAACVISATASAQRRAPSSLRLGDQAPELNLTFVKGEPVTLAEGKGTDVYIVEFWATWCGPCLTSIPHLTELQKKYGDKGLVIVGVTDEDPADVNPFLAKMGEKMDYRVAIDRNKATNKALMVPFRQEGIPHAFVIDKLGRIVWHGHPMDPLMGKLIPVLLNQDVSANGGSASKDEGSTSKTSDSESFSD